jgi:hypothetical protein
MGLLYLLHLQDFNYKTFSEQYMSEIADQFILIAKNSQRKKFHSTATWEYRSVGKLSSNNVPRNGRIRFGALLDPCQGQEKDDFLFQKFQWAVCCPRPTLCAKLLSVNKTLLLPAEVKN